MATTRVGTVGRRASAAKVMAVVALVVSGLGLVFCAAAFFGLLSLLVGVYYGMVALVYGLLGSPLAAVGIALGVIALIMARRRGEKTRLARLALILGVIGVALAAFAAISTGAFSPNWWHTGATMC